MKTAEDESEKEQRVEDHTHEEYENDVFHEDQRKAEVQAEWILLLHALDMDTSSQFTDMLTEVSLTRESALHLS